MTSHKCSDFTITGRTCRAWSIKGTDPPLCAIHSGRTKGAGAPPGNQNRSEHSFYSRFFTLDDFVVPAGGRIDCHLQWSVPATAKISTPDGPKKVYDDRLISASLVSLYDGLIASGQLRLGRAASAIVPPIDPLDNLSF